MSTVTFIVHRPAELFKPVLPVLKAVDTSQPDYRFAQVFITDKSVHVLATDRYTLVESRQSVDGNDPGVMFLPLDAVAALAKYRAYGSALVVYTTENGKPGTPATVTVDNQTLAFDVPRLPAVASVTGQAWAPRGIEPQAPLSLGSATFDTVAKVAKATGKHAIMTFHGTDGGSKPYAVEINENVRMLVMPIRVNDSGRTIFADWAPLSETIEAAQPAVSNAA